MEGAKRQRRENEKRTVFGRPHRPSIDVHIRIDLDSGHFETCGLEQEASRRGCLFFFFVFRVPCSCSCFVFSRSLFVFVIGCQVFFFFRVFGVFGIGFVSFFMFFMFFFFFEMEMERKEKKRISFLSSTNAR